MKCLRFSFRQLTLAAGLSLFLLGTQSAKALDSDRTKPADIQADDTEFDFKKGTRTFLKNVLAIQGTLRLKADKLIAIYGDDALQKATMWGSPARFKQRPEGKPDDVQGWAKKMIVDHQTDTITLIGNAALQQGPDTARGETIIYNMGTDTLQVKGGAKIGSGGDTGQARPNKKIEDPFADDEIPSAPSADQTVSKTKDTDTDDGASKEQAKDEDKTPWVAPTSSGRSRLILRPRKKPKETDEDDKDEESEDDESDTEKESSN